MAVLKHIASKNADYTAAEQYLIFQHDESSGKLLLDESGYPMLRGKYILQGIKLFFVLSVILTILVGLYFYLFGFSPDKFVRIGQYGGLAMCVIVVISNYFG